MPSPGEFFHSFRGKGRQARGGFMRCWESPTPSAFVTAVAGGRASLARPFTSPIGLQ